MDDHTHQFDWIKPNWPAPRSVACVSTTRQGGVSQGKYSSFNLGAHVADDEQHVKANRQLLHRELELSDRAVWLNQQHSKKIVRITSSCTDDIQADAAYTTEQEKVCAVLTADCLPVLFCDQRGSCVAVAHAGWRGLLSGVLENSLKALPVEADKILCWLGPAIGPSKFEVGEELRHEFITKDHRHDMAFQQGQQADKYLANIYQLAKNILTVNGVEAIFGGGYCTYTEKDRFFSYRRDGRTGRMATLIWIKR